MQSRQCTYIIQCICHRTFRVGIAFPLYFCLFSDCHMCQTSKKLTGWSLTKRPYTLETRWGLHLRPTHAGQLAESPPGVLDSHWPCHQNDNRRNNSCFSRQHKWHHSNLVVVVVVVTVIFCSRLQSDYMMFADCTLLRAKAKRPLHIMTGNLVCHISAV